MNSTIKLLCFTFAHGCTTLFGQSKQNVFQLLNNKNFFKAQEVYSNTQKDYKPWEQQYILATLANAFNKTEHSNTIIDELLGSNTPLPDSITTKLYLLKTDNYTKLYEYKAAAETIDFLMTNYTKSLSEKIIDDLKNNFKIWNALKDEPKQVILKPATTEQLLKHDKVGLKNLNVTYQDQSIDFIFDTGANISTITESSAKKLNMKIIPAGIEVGSITGQKIITDLAICPSFKIGDIEIKNAIFLLFPDKALYFEQIQYGINGIIGFPIMDALGEIQITKDDRFIIPANETRINQSSNMALDGFNPLIYMNGMHFSFDTGATETMLYTLFYEKNKAAIDAKNYPVTEFNLGGAAGFKTFKGHLIQYAFDIYDKQAKFDDLQLIIEQIKDDETLHGNIGQDLIQQFDKMTLNFNQMFIKFD